VPKRQAYTIAVKTTPLFDQAAIAGQIK